MLILAITASIVCRALRKKQQEDWLVGGVLIGFFLTIVISSLFNGAIPTEKVLSHTENLQPFYDRITGQGPFLLEEENGTYFWRSEEKEETCDTRSAELIVQKSGGAKVEVYVLAMKPFWRLIVFPPELGMPRFVYTIRVDYEKINFVLKKPN